MTEQCHRADEVDLVSYVANPNDPALMEFHLHRQSCSTCTAAIAEFEQVAAFLRKIEDDVGFAHPTEAELGSYIGGELRGEAHESVAEHVRTCAQCRDQVAAVKRLDFAAFRSAAEAARRTQSLPARADRSAERRFGGWIKRLLWSPAFAYGFAILVLSAPIIRLAFQPPIYVGHDPETTPGDLQSGVGVVQARLGQYKQGYEGRDLRRIKAVWSLTPAEVEALEKSFAQPGRLVLLYQVLDTLADTSDRAVVRFLEVASRIGGTRGAESTSTIRTVEAYRSQSSSPWTMRSSIAGY